MGHIIEFFKFLLKITFTPKKDILILVKEAPEAVVDSLYRMRLACFLLILFMFCCLCFLLHVITNDQQFNTHLTQLKVDAARVKQSCTDAINEQQIIADAYSQRASALKLYYKTQLIQCGCPIK